MKVQTKDKHIEVLLEENDYSQGAECFNPYHNSFRLNKLQTARLLQVLSAAHDYFQAREKMLLSSGGNNNE